MSSDFRVRGVNGYPDADDDSIGQTEAKRNEEQRLRDNQGGSELTNRPEANPVGAAGETVSALAEGPPPDHLAEVGAPVRAAGPVETTLPDESPLVGEEEDDISPFDDEKGE